ncbi:MAG TPA: 5-aminolevulinate synthase [Alphaproteobacteria bacterium]|nr:5-aminolevulinate synthase [Alphaproteobacteria bacterium]
MFTNYNKLAENALNEIKRKGLYRNYPLISQSPENPPYGFNHKTDEKVIIWGNNNYLSISSHPDVIKAKIEAIKKYGTGSGGTRNVLGTSDILNELENRIAKFHNKEKAVIHNSALDANIGVLSALGKYFPNTIFLSDESNHASIIDGIRASGASKYIFRHNDLKDLEKKLIKIRNLSDTRPIIIVLESIYSMSGDIAPLEKVIELKKKYNAFIYLDEVHAIGVNGKNGSGVASELKLENEIDIICGTFGKAFGQIGGYIAANEVLCEFLRHYSRNFIFTTALPSDVAAACLAVLNIFESDEGEVLRSQHKQAVSNTKKYLKEYNIPFLDFGTHIIPVILNDEKRTSKIALNLFSNHKIAVTPIFAPTVSVGKARLRINPTPKHTEEMSKDLAIAISNEIKNNPEILFSNEFVNDNSGGKTNKEII